MTKIIKLEFIKRYYSTFIIFVNKLHDHPFIKICEILAGIFFIVFLIIGAINYLDKSNPDYIVITKIENLKVSDKFHNLNKKETVGRYEVWDLCGIRFLYNFVIPDNFGGIKDLGGVQFGIGDFPIIYSVAVLTEKEKGIMSLIISSEETNFSIEKRRASVEIVGESNEVVGLTEKKLEVNLETLSSNQQFLFNIIPEKDGKIDIKCFNTDRKCEPINANIQIFKIPFFTNTITVSNNLKVYLREPDYNKVTLYEVNSNGMLREVSTDNSPVTEMVFSEISCIPSGKIGKTI